MDEHRTNEDEMPHPILSGAVDAALADLRRGFGEFDFAGFHRALAAMPEAFVFCSAEALNWTEPDQIACLVSGAAAFGAASGKETFVEGHLGQYVVLLAGGEREALAAIERAAARAAKRRRR